MIKPFSSIIIGALLCLISQYALAEDENHWHYLGSAECPGVEQLAHVPGHSWTVRDNRGNNGWTVFTGWVISQQDIYSPLTQFSENTTLQRKVEPYHFGFNLADVTCTYNISKDGYIFRDSLVLKRTYREGYGLFPSANYIIADDNLNKLSNDSLPDTSSCNTDLSNIQLCKWDFYSFRRNDIFF